MLCCVDKTGLNGGFAAERRWCRAQPQKPTSKTSSDQIVTERRRRCRRYGVASFVRSSHHVIHVTSPRVDDEMTEHLSTAAKTRVRAIATLPSAEFSGSRRRLRGLPRTAAADCTCEPAKYDFLLVC